MVSGFVAPLQVIFGKGRHCWLKIPRLQRLIWSFLCLIWAQTILADEKKTEKSAPQTTICSVQPQTAVTVWPRFRGPNGFAWVELDLDLPNQWEKHHILWNTPLNHLGASSPVVWDSHCYLTSADTDGQQRFLTCYDSVTGKPKWQYTVLMDSHEKHNKNSYATATPVTDGDRVYITFGSPKQFRVFCLAGESGKLIWERNIGGYVAQHGHGASPILADDFLIVTNEQENAPSNIMAFNRFNGEIIWETPRVSERAAYSTPFVFNTPNHRLLIFSSTLGLTALRISDGKLHWFCDVFDARTVGSPFYADGLVGGICGSGNRGHKLVLIDPNGSGDIAGSNIIWQRERTLPYCPTPLAVADLLFLVAENGIVTCLHSKDGQELWQERLPSNFSASPIGFANRILALGEKGKIYLFAADRTYRNLAQNQLDDFFLATPAVANGRLYLRGENYLWCIGVSEVSTP